MLSPRWRKVIRDVWDNRPRTALVVLAIAVGVAAFGGVFSARAILLADWRRGYTATTPAQIIILGSDYDRGVVQAVAAMREVQTVEGRSSYPLQISSPDGTVYTLTLTVPPDLSQMDVDRLVLEDGRWPLERELMLERMSAGLLGVQPGDRLTVSLPDGRNLGLLLVGTAHDYLASPATDVSPFLAGYVTPETLRQLGHPGTYDELHIVTTDPAASNEALSVIANRMCDRIEADGYPVSGVTAQQLTDHWAAQVIDGLTAIMVGIGLFSLLLGIFLVINTISAILVQQTRQIGMMKAVGARGRDVVGIYLAIVGIFGGLGLLVAVPLGIGLAYGVITFLNDSMLNLDILRFRLPGWVLGLQMAAALGVPLLAALSPVLKEARATPHAALTDYGVSAGFATRQREGHSPIRLPASLLLTARNLFRRRGRAILTLATLTLAGTIFMSVVNVRGGFMDELSAMFRMIGHDIQIPLERPYPLRQLNEFAARMPGVTSAEGWLGFSVRRIRADGSKGEPFTLLGQPVPSDYTDPVLLDGRWLLPDDQGALVIGSEILRLEPDLQVGDTIELEIDQRPTTWTVVGIARVYALPNAYANRDYLSQVTHLEGQGKILYIGTAQHDADTQQQVADDLQDRMQRAGMKIGPIMTQQTLIGVYIGVVDFVMYFLVLMAILLAVIGGLGLAGTMSVNLIERTREIGIMRAVGASGGAIGWMVVSEALLLGLMSWLLAAIISLPFSAGFSAFAGTALMDRPLPPVYQPGGYLLWLVVVEIIAALASLLPARRASRISVREALAYE